MTDQAKDKSNLKLTSKVKRSGKSKGSGGASKSQESEAKSAQSSPITRAGETDKSRTTKGKPAHTLPTTHAVGEAPEQEIIVSREKLLEGFVTYFTEEQGMPTISARLQMDEGTFRRRIREAYHQEAIRIRTPENKQVPPELDKKWGGPHYHVLDAVSDRFFYSGAAEIFFIELNELLQQRLRLPESERPARLTLGLVSGKTTGGMVEALCDPSFSWSTMLNSDLLPKEIRIYALNVSQTDGYEQLRGNANVLAFELAKRFMREFPEGRKVEAYGLSTELLQTADNARESDTGALTSKVLECTDPQRLRDSFRNRNKPIPATLGLQSELDVVIAGVGSIRSTERKNQSFFRQYCEANGINISDLETRHHMVGDISYFPVSKIGELLPLMKDHVPHEFYTAISLQVLQFLSLSQLKKVILVARGVDKVAPIVASISAYRRDGPSQHGPYCNVLITDLRTGNYLLREP